jgi:hypothetical protein
MRLSWKHHLDQMPDWFENFASENPEVAEILKPLYEDPKYTEALTILGLDMFEEGRGSGVDLYATELFWDLGACLSKYGVTLRS